MEEELEIWKEIKDFDGYEVSNTGLVWSGIRNKLLTLSEDPYGYYKVSLYSNGIQKVKKFII